MENNEPFFGISKLTPNEAKEKLKVAQSRLKYSNKILDEILKDEKENKQLPDELIPIFSILKDLMQDSLLDVSHVLNREIKASE